MGQKISKKSPGTLFPSLGWKVLSYPPVQKKYKFGFFCRVKDKALCKNGFFRWRNFKILPTTNFMNLNEKCKPDWKRKKNFKKKKISHHNTEKTKQTKKYYPFSLF